MISVLKHRSIWGQARSFVARLSSVWVALALLAAPAEAQPVTTENVETEFHSSRAAIAPGETFTIVLRQKIREHWHTYWRNPGDSGEATEIEWTLPAGFTAGPIQWPAPEPLPFDILVNYGYSGEILFPIAITAPSTLRAGQSATLSGEVYWLVCSDICIPEQGILTLTLPVAAQGADDPTWAPRIAAAVAALPQPAPFEARISPGDPAQLSLALPNPSALRDPYFFPYARDVLTHSARQNPSVGGRGLSFSLTPGIARNLGTVPLEGVFIYVDAQGEKRSYEINAQPGEPLPNSSGRQASMSEGFGGVSGAPEAAPAAPLDSGALALALVFAFLGGLILNIMPCVLPVLSIKALSFAGGAHSGEAKRHGLLYLGGVLLTFLALAGVLIALRSAGEAVGWGFQFQAPWVSAGLALLFFAIGLNLVGVFEIGGGAQNLGAGLATRGGDLGAFFTGALAVIAATPCTAPFMAGAIGAVLTQSAAMTLLVFAVLGLGFALPLVALSFAPGLQRAIPKPGPWMERVRNVLAFPMFATAVWLAWVLAQQSGPNGALALLSVAVALAFLVFVARWGRIWFIVAAVVLAATSALSWPSLSGRPQVETLVSAPWSAAAVAQAQSEGKGVFVNFTAAWCVTCQVNERVALSRPRVAAAFAERGIVYLKADWTNRDADIAAALAAHGRAGVPLYLYYPPGADSPVVLPQHIVLTEDVVLSTVAAEGEGS